MYIYIYIYIYMYIYIYIYIRAWIVMNVHIYNSLVKRTIFCNFVETN